MKKIFTLAFITIAFVACQETPAGKEQADLIVHNAKIYTVDSAFSTAQSFVVKDGKILAVGTNEEIQGAYEATDNLDVAGKALYPGFIDAHCHFYGYGKGLQKANLVGTTSYEEVIEKVKEYSQSNKGEWVVGRGWDQNDWEVKKFPTKEKLDEAFPDTPVMLTRIDGHAVLVNSEAMRRSEITKDSKIDGGDVILGEDGEPTGVLVDNAIGLAARNMPETNYAQTVQALLDAQSNCFAVGLTTVDDAGLSKNLVALIDSLHKTGDLKMRVYAMLSSGKSTLNYYLEKGPSKTDLLNVRSFKFFADGALGSRGACLLHPYSDKPDQQGFLLDEITHYEEFAQKLYDKGFQMNTHCIGDSANRALLDIYAAVLKGENDKRWRIEHAQVINIDDFKKFGAYSIIPSIQTTHGTSDMYWAEDRLGPERVKGAYAYKDLLEQNGLVANGSDFPVEHINPLFGFYAATARMDQKGFPEGGFQKENALTREEALRAMTIWAAYSNFEENEKGSIEAGKFADFVILEKDIMEIPETETYSVKVTHTFVNGEKVFQLD